MLKKVILQVCPAYAIYFFQILPWIGSVPIDLVSRRFQAGTVVLTKIDQRFGNV